MKHDLHSTENVGPITAENTSVIDLNYTVLPKKYIIKFIFKDALPCDLN